MKSLATLIKFQKTKVDEQRLMLAKVQDALTSIAQMIARLEEQKREEQAAAKKNPEDAITYGEFVKRSIKKGHELERQKQIAIAAVNAAHDKLTELFEEQKRFEIAEANRIEAEAREDRRYETAELDEIGGVVHERRKT